jgi:hypothetical protein
MASIEADMEEYLAGSEPDGLADAPVLDDWKASSRGGRMMIVGTRDGERLYTSEVRWIDRDFRWARTSNTLYRLGNSAVTDDKEVDQDGG